MEQIIEKIGWKKLAIGMIIGGSLFAIFIIYSFARALNPNVSEKSSQEIVKENISPMPLLTKKSDADKKYSTDQLEITYPSDWIIQERTVLGGGSFTSIVPLVSITTNHEIFPRIDIKIEPTNALSSEQRAERLSIYNLDKSTVIFQNRRAIKLSGVLPFTFKVGNPPVNKKVNKTFIFWDSPRSAYSIDYAYYEDRMEDKKKLDAILSTLVVKK